MIKALIRFSMKNMVALLLMILLIVGGGIYSLKQINIEKYPNVDIPYMTVVIPYPGASPDQSIKDVGEPVEKEMMNLEGVKNVYTEATANAAYVTMEFDMSIDMQEEEGVVRSAIEKINLPEEVEEPEIVLQGPDGDPSIYSMGIYAKDGTANGGDHFIKNRMVPALESLNGVSEVKVDGLENKQVFVRLLPDELEKNGLTLADVKNTIQANHLSIPTGDVTLANQVFPVRVGKELQSVEDVKNIQVFTKGTTDGQTPMLGNVRLSDIAEISYDTQNKSDFTRINGKQGVSIGIIPEGGSNVVEIVKNVKETVKDLELPEEYEVTTLRDQSIEIKESVFAMLKEALLGALMAVLVTLLFLRNIRSTLISVISIPLSILASFIVLNMMGYTLNIMTLAGIAVAVGRVVDDSIVVIENVFRRVRVSKERSEKLVEQSTREVASAITSSTITTIAVFLPMAVVPGLIGHFFAPLAWTVVISLLFSLLVAITVVPLLSKLFLLNISSKEHHENKIQLGYRKCLKWVLSHRFVTLLMAIVLLASSAGFIAPKLGTTFLPQEKVSNYDVSITMEKGTDPKETSDVAAKVERLLLDSDKVKKMSTTVKGEHEFASISFELNDSMKDIDGVIKDYRSQFANIHEAKEISVTGIGGIAGGGESQYVLVVEGQNLDDIKKASTEITGVLKNLNGMADVHTSLEGDDPEISIDMNEEKLVEHGLMPAMVGSGLHDLIQGDVVTSINIDDDQKEVQLLLNMDDISSLQDLENQEIPNMMGMPVKLKDIGELKEVKNRTVITHLNANEYVMVVGQITDSKTGDVSSKAEKLINELDLPEGVSYYKEGAAAAMDEGFSNMAIAIGVSILLVYMVMVIAFGEGKAPFVILFAIPFSIIGALIGLFIVKQPIGMPAMIGLLMLNGIVVTNAIVLVDRVKQNGKNGLDIQEALIDAGVVRLRPILMTAIATIGSLLPMALSSHAGIVSASLAVVVIGGLTTSTLLTLFVVPVLYSLFHPKRKQKKIVEKAEEVELN